MHANLPGQLHAEFIESAEFKGFAMSEDLSPSDLQKRSYRVRGVLKTQKYNVSKLNPIWG